MSAFLFFFLVIPSGTNLLLAWVAQPAKEKMCKRKHGLIWLLKSLNVKKDESDLVMGKDLYYLLIKNEIKKKKILSA